MRLVDTSFVHSSFPNYYHSFKNAIVVLVAKLFDMNEKQENEK